MKLEAMWVAGARFLAMGLVLVTAMSVQARIESGFTYQGELRLADTPIEGDHDFRFRLYSSETDGARVGPELSQPSVAVLDGVFTVQLDFGADALTGAPRWLEIDVRASGEPGYETLAPRTLLASVPYAWGAAWALPGSVSTDSIQSGAVGGAQIDPAEVQRRVSAACPAGEFLRAINPDGTVVCAAGGAGGGSAWLLGGNAGTNPQTDFLGTSDDQPLVLAANGQLLGRIEAISPGTGNFTANIVMGNPDNAVRPGVRGAVIAGGGLPLSNPNEFFRPNVVTDNFGTVGGGHANVAGIDDASPSNASWATVGGGADNRAAGQSATVSGGEKNFAINNSATISGGKENTARGVSSTVAGGADNEAAALDSVVSGGSFNTAGSTGAVVAGGTGNSALGSSSVIGGGELNCAGGNYSWAGGRRSKVRPATESMEVLTGCDNVPGAGVPGGDQGTFIWADSQNANFQSTGPNQFLVRAQGGVYFGTGGPVSFPADAFISTSTGAYMDSNGVWQLPSGQVLKTGFQAIDPLDILDRLLRLPMRSWSYKASPESDRHLGPVAEEFHASFGLGSDDASISWVDASGVALAAIQGLNQRLETENAALRRQNETQDAAIDELRRELQALRARLDGPSAATP
jgi:hypothetical protein